MAPADRPRTRRSVIAVLVAVFSTSAASMAGVTALGKQVYDLTGRELDLGLLGLAEFLPAALLVLVTGQVADRYDRRRVAAIGIAVEAVAAGALGWYATSDPTSAGPIFALVIVFGVGRAFVAPAARALPADIVAPERLPWLVPRYSATWQAAVIVGPVLGGSLYAIDESLPFVAMVVLLGLAAVAILSVDVRDRQPAADVGLVDDDPAPRPGLHDALEGLRFIRRQPILLGAIGLDLFAVLFGGAVALLPAIAEERLGVDSVGLGWLRAAGGVGAAAVTLALARRPIRRRVGRRLLFAVAVFGAGTIVLGITTSFVVALVAMAVLSGADAISVFIRATLVPLVTPERTRGRVLAVENVFIGASNELGAFESGVAGQALGAGPAIVLGGVATIAVAGLWWRRFPALRDVDTFPTSAAEASVSLAGSGMDTDSPRIAPLAPEDRDDRTEELLRSLRGDTDGPDLNIFATLARHPRLLKRWSAFGGVLLYRGELPPRDRELLILRTAWNCGAEYEWGQHVAIGIAAGVTPEEVDRVAGSLEDAGWSDDDAALLRAADELHADAKVGDPTWAALAGRYSDAQLLELCMVVGQYHLVAFTLNSAGVQREPGVGGFPQ